MLTGRGWTAGLLLFAVLVVHGLECTSAADRGGHAAHVDGIAAVLALTPADMHGAPPPVAPVHEESALTSSAVHHTAPPETAAGGASRHAPGLPGHLWAACLAVLAAGLAVLLALAVPRLLRLAPPAEALSWLRGRSWPAPLRPPDLFSLCVLRT